MMQPLIKVQNLTFRYDDGTVALAGVNFRLDAGETVALLGANGSGKTTFVLNLNGLLAGQGDIQVCGMPLEKRNLPSIRRKIGMVFQDADSQLFMPTVIEDVSFGLLNLGLTSEQALTRAKEALAVVGISSASERAPYHLSAGE